MSAPSRRRFFQFNLRGVLVLTTVVAIFFGLWVSKLHRRQQAIRKLGVSTWAARSRVRYREAPYTGWLHRPWLTRLIGEGFFDEPVEIRLTAVSGQNGEWVGDAKFYPVGPLPTLRRLSLDYSNAGDNGMSYLSELRNLEQLNLDSSRAGDEGLAVISGLAKLEELDLSNTPVTDAGIKHLAGLARLRILSLQNTKVGDEGIARLKNLDRLVSLNLAQTRVEGRIPGEFHEFKDLRELRLSGSRFTDRGLESLNQCAALESVWLDGTSVTGSGFAAVTDLPALARLDLSATALTDEGLQRLPAAPALRTLNLNGTLITDEGLKRLGQYKSLEVLDLHGTKITGKALSYLQTLPRLTYLNLCGTGVDDDIEALNELCPLACVSLLDTKVTWRGLNRLQVAGAVSDEPVDQRTMATLDEPTELGFANQPFVDVVDYLQQRHELRLLVEPSLRDPPTNLALTPITYDVKDISVLEAIERILAPLDLVMVYRHGVLLIAKRPVRPALQVPELAEGQQIGGALEAVLSEKTELDFASIPLADIVAYLSARHEIPIRIDEEAFRRAERTSQVQLTWYVKGIPLRSALGLILEPLDMTCVVEDEALVIQPRPKVEPAKPPAAKEASHAE